MPCSAMHLAWSCWCRGRLPRKSWNIFGRQLIWVLSCFCIFRHSFHFRAAMHFHSGLWLAFVTLPSIMDPLLPYHTMLYRTISYHVIPYHTNSVYFTKPVLLCGIVCMHIDHHWKPFTYPYFITAGPRKSCTLSELAWKFTKDLTI